MCISGCLGQERVGTLTKGPKGTFNDGGNILYLGCSGGYVTKNADLVACHNESQTRDTGASAKGKKYIQAL